MAWVPVNDGQPSAWVKQVPEGVQMTQAEYEAYVSAKGFAERAESAYNNTSLLYNDTVAIRDSASGHRGLAQAAASASANNAFTTTQDRDLVEVLAASVEDNTERAEAAAALAVEIAENAGVYDPTPFNAHLADQNNPHGVTGAQLGLGSAAYRSTEYFALASDFQDLATAVGGKAPAVHSHAFADLTAKPTTRAGYGITDAASSVQGGKADSAVQPAALTTALNDYYTKTTADARYALTAHTHTFASLTAKPTTRAGYGITDAAASVHSHAFADLTAKPTTVAGYGITDFNLRSIGQSGYQQFPGGLIQQWGSVVLNGDANGDAWITFPISFNNANWTIQLTNGDVDNKKNVTLGARTPSSLGGCSIKITNARDEVPHVGPFRVNYAVYGS